MSALKLTDIIKAVRWEQPPPSTNARFSTRTSRGGGGGGGGGGETTARNVNPTRLDRLKHAFLSDMPLLTEGKTIAQSIASLDTERREQYDVVCGRRKIHRSSDVYGSTEVHDEQEKEWKKNTDTESSRREQRKRWRAAANVTAAPHETLFHRYGGRPALNASERVVRSHLRYLNEFEPFRRGQVTLHTMYEFVFHMVVEKGRRESYTKRVIISILSYLKAGGASAMGNLTEESKRYVNESKGLGGVKMSNFYRRMNAVTNALGDDQTKRLLSTARCKRALIFNDDEEARILRYCVSALRNSIGKYLINFTSHGKTSRRYFFSTSDTTSSNDANVLSVCDVRTGTTSSGDYDKATCAMNVKSVRDGKIEINTDVPASETSPSRVGYERTIFEFAFAYMLGFLSGARIKSTVLRLSVDDINILLNGGRLEVLTKGVFVNVFLPAVVLTNEPDLYGSIMPLRTRSVLYRDNCPGRVGGIVKQTDSFAKVFLTGKNIFLDRNDTVSGDDECNSSDESGTPLECTLDRKESDNENNTLGKFTGQNPQCTAVDMAAKRSKALDEKCRDAQRGRGECSNQNHRGKFFTRSPRQLELMLDRVYKSLFNNKKRAKGVRWHSQRRRYIGTVNSKYGATTASESVGHRDLSTTMMYINNSIHMDDVRRKAGEAITELYDNIIVAG